MNDDGDDGVIILHNETTDKDEEFYVLAYFEHEDSNFIVLQPVEPLEDIGEDEVLIYEVVENEDSEEGVDLLPIEDEDLLQAVYEDFLQICEENECDGDCDCCDDGCDHDHHED